MSKHSESKRVLDYLKSHSFLVILVLVGSTLFLLIVFTILDMFINRLILNLDNFILVIFDWWVWQSIILTFYCSFLATIICIAFGTPLSFILAKYEFKGKQIIDSILNIPLMIPHSVAGILIYSLFMSRGVIGAPAKEIGIIFEDNILGITVALLFVSMPIYINSVRDGFMSINPHLSRVAYSLGANDRQVFTKIYLPLSGRFITTGSVMTWARGISEFGAVILIAYYPMIAPVLVYYAFNTKGLNYSGPISLILILLCLLVFIGLFYLTKEKKITED